MAVPRPRYGNRKKRYKRKDPNKSKFKQGFFTNISEKYVQPSNKYMNSEQFPQYRSSWELQFMKWCEQSDLVEKWSTESVSIPYFSPKDGLQHRYFPDFFLKLKDGRKFIIEIKPHNQKKMPINQAKWESAEQWAKENGYQFLVLSEKELKKWGII
jgi:hypothetical protein